MFNVYLMHKIILYVKNRETIRTILEHRDYRKYMNKNESIYDELVYKYIFELNTFKHDKMINSMQRWRIYNDKKIKVIKSMYRMRERVQSYFPYIIVWIYYKPETYMNIGEEIRNGIIKNKMEEMEEWMKQEGMIKREENINTLYEMREMQGREWYH